MNLLPLLCLVITVSSAPSEVVDIDASTVESTSSLEPQKEVSAVLYKHPEGGTEDVQTVSKSPSEVTIEELVEEPQKKGLGHNVEQKNYKIPPGMFKEKLYTNYWMWFLRYAQYSLDFHYHCPYEIVQEEEGEKLKQGDTKKCVCSVQLNYWIEEIREEILLDTYKIPFDDGSEELAESSIILSHPDVNVHTVSLAMKDGTCKQMQYTIQDDTSVTQEEKDIDCKEVEKKKKDNDHWALENMPTKDEMKVDSTSTDKDEKSEALSDFQVSNNAEPTEATNSDDKIADKILTDGESADKIAAEEKTSDQINAEDISTGKITVEDKTADKIKAEGITAAETVYENPTSNAVTTEKTIEPIQEQLDTDDSFVGSVIASNYKLPAGPFKEFRFANHWVSVKNYPKYSINFYFVCPFELEPYHKLTVRQADLEECRSVIKLSMYSEEQETDIILDTYKIRGMYINQDVINSIIIEEVVENKTVVILRMVNEKCRKKTYEVTFDGVKAVKEEVPCPKLPEKTESAEEEDDDKDE